MPRGPRLDYPGALHHLIVRGIERGVIFRTDHDRQIFLDRLATVVLDTHAGLYAWALMPNHAHALLRTGTLPLSRLALRWLGPYASAFNRRHRRVGYLFQNRFKNVLVEEDPYFLELVRYIHLNPVRSRLPVSMDTLDQYPWTGHSVLLGHRRFPAQDTDSVLNRFGATVGAARKAYWEFVQQGMMGGRQPDLEGGGLRRSSGTWQLTPALARGRERWAFDERILGSHDFVEGVLQRLDGKPPPPVRDATAVVGTLCERVGDRFRVSRGEIASASLRREVLAARAVVSHLAVTRYGLSLSAVGRCLNVSKQSIARALARAGSVYHSRHYAPAEFIAD